MDPNRRTRLISTLAIALIVAGMAYFGYRTVTRILERVEWTAGQRRELPARTASGSDGRVSLAVPDLSGFSEITVKGSWKITIVDGDYNVSVSTRERSAAGVHVSQRGSALVLSADQGLAGVTGGYEATIALPELRSIAVDGGAEIALGALTLDRLTLSVAGAATIEAVDATITTLHVDVDGAANVDFTSSLVTNARIDISGAANVAVTMNGGTLQGTVSGFGNVSYSGNVSRRDIQVEGLGSVHER